MNPNVTRTPTNTQYERRVTKFNNPVLLLRLMSLSSVITVCNFNPHAVIASHKRPGNDDNPQIIEETRQYISDFDQLAETTTTSQELYDKMLELYPNRVNPDWALWSSARAASQVN